MKKLVFLSGLSLLFWLSPCGLSASATALISLRKESTDWKWLMKNDYLEMYFSATVDSRRIDEAELRVYRIRNNLSRYLVVAQITKIPWFVIASIHSLECDLNFNCHLHNGDPLNSRTIREPSGRPFAPPESGNFPYTWEESAVDALMNSDLWKPKNWNVAGVLEYLERYNGLGYEHRGINTPYLWSATSLYTSGLFVSDDKFDPQAVSKQIGAAALLKVMSQKGYIQQIKETFNDSFEKNTIWL